MGTDPCMRSVASAKRARWTTIWFCQNNYPSMVPSWLQRLTFTAPKLTLTAPRNLRGASRRGLSLRRLERKSQPRESL